MRNRLFDALPRDIRGELDAVAERVTLNRGHVLHRPGEKIVHLYFPLDAMVSITITMGEGRTVETGVAGNREVAGVNAFMGDSETTQTEYNIQIDGELIKVPAAPLLRAFGRTADRIARRPHAWERTDAGRARVYGPSSTLWRFPASRSRSTTWSARCDRAAPPHSRPLPRSTTSIESIRLRHGQQAALDRLRDPEHVGRAADTRAHPFRSRALRSRADDDRTPCTPAPHRGGRSQARPLGWRREDQQDLEDRWVL